MTQTPPSPPKCIQFVPDTAGVMKEYAENTGISFENAFGGQKICTCGLVTNQHPGVQAIPQRQSPGLGPDIFAIYRMNRRRS